MAMPRPLLGFAFTNADFCSRWTRTARSCLPPAPPTIWSRKATRRLVGKPAGKLFKPSEGIKFATFAKALKSGDRAGPFKLTLATGADANLAMFRLPRTAPTFPAPWRGRARATPAARIDPKTGLASRDGFMAAAEKAGDRRRADPGQCAGPARTLRPASGRQSRRADAAHRRQLQSCGANATGRCPTPASAPWRRQRAARWIWRESWPKPSPPMA